MCETTKVNIELVGGRGVREGVGSERAGKRKRRMEGERERES